MGATLLANRKGLGADAEIEFGHVAPGTGAAAKSRRIGALVPVSGFSASDAPRAIAALSDPSKAGAANVASTAVPSKSLLLKFNSRDTSQSPAW